MAIDLTSKALDIASEASREADNFLDAFEALVKILAVATDSGINMATYDSALAGPDSGVKHVDGATFNKLQTAIPNITTAIDAADSGGSGITIRELFNQLRQNL